MGFHSPADGGHAFDPDVLDSYSLKVGGAAVSYPQGHIVPMHQHRSGHLVYADRGLLRVETENGRWLVPPTSAVWLRPGVPHRLIAPVALQAFGLFVSEEASRDLPSTDCVVQVSDLLRALIIRLTSLGHPAAPSRTGHLLGELLIEELRTPPPLPLHLPWPQDEKIKLVCDTLMADPSHENTADQWASAVALGVKTFHRHFLKSTGITFGRWRQRLRLMSSLTLLTQEASITEAALASGYDSHSAYTHAFKKQFGVPPSAFARAGR